MKIAIAVQSGLTNQNEKTDDWLLKAELERRGIEVDLVDWRDPAVNWTQYDSIFVSSTWNMPAHADEVKSWIDTCESGKKRLINDAELIKFSLNKEQYLTFLQEQFKDQDSSKGCITPSEFIHAKDRLSFSEKISSLTQKNALWAGDIVMKPIISADGMGTYRLTNEQNLLKNKGKNYRSFAEAESVMTPLLNDVKSQGVIIQPYIPSVENSGEYQLVYLGGEFSHATVKPPGFKNNNTGGRIFIAPDKLPSEMLNFANRLINVYEEKYPDGITRARFDFFAGDNGPILCEAEMIEPNTNIRRLDSAQQKKVIEKYADVLVNRTKRLIAIPEKSEIDRKVQAIIDEELKTDSSNTDKYAAINKNPDVCKAFIKIHETSVAILEHLKGTTKYTDALPHNSIYRTECFDALNEFAKKENPTIRDKNKLISSLDNAQKKYSANVLSKDRSDLSKAMRLMLLVAVNFITAFTFGIAHSKHYKETGNILFYSETKSQTKLKASHKELSEKLDSSLKINK